MSDTKVNKCIIRKINESLFWQRDLSQLNPYRNHKVFEEKIAMDCHTTKGYVRTIKKLL